MGTASGYVLYLEASRQRIFEECVEEETTFAEPVPEFRHSRHVPLICLLISSERLITHVARGRRGTKAGTALRRLNLDGVEQLRSPISVERVLDRIPGRLRASVESRFSNGGLLTSKGFNGVVEALRELDQGSSAILERFSRDRAERMRQLSREARRALAFQKEAVVTALAIAGLDRYPLQEWTPPDAPGTQSFLDGLPTARLREDPMVVHDLMNLPGFDLINTLPYNAAVFESDQTRLTVVLANRQPLEQQTGTDLIYYNETFHCFVMVQYKAMEHDNEHGAVFRLPNAQLAAEIARMDALLAALRACEPDDSRDGFRFNDNPFFLKLCPRLVFNPDDVGLVPGMYLPLDYWKALVRHSTLLGPRGGERITYDNVGRHFDNSSFISLVAKSWVGTTVTQSAVLAAVIRETLEAGKAVAVAVKTDAPAQEELMESE
jgi:hypothetical protein